MKERSNPITEVSLTNYGKFADHTFQLTPGLNVIRGPNRSGKTWILRGISTVLANTGYWNDEPERDEIRHVDKDGEIATFFEATLEFQNGLGIRRYRDSDINAYKVSLPGSREWEQFTAIGAGFFDQIGDLTGIFPVSLDGRDEQIINTKLMTDPRFFILGETERTQNRILTRLVGMDVVEAAEQDVASDIRGLQSDLRDVQANQEDANKTLEKYAPAADAMELVSVMEDAAEKHMHLSETASAGRVYLDDLNKAEDRLGTAQFQIAILGNIVPELEDKLNQIVDAMEDAERGKELFQAAAQKMGRIKTLTNRIETLSDIEEIEDEFEDAKSSQVVAQNAANIMSDLSTAVQRGQSAESTVSVLEPNIPKVGQLLDDASGSIQKFKTASSLWSNLNEAEENFENRSTEVERHQKKLNDLWDTVSVCPLCEREI